jgi:hypothetical protein
LADEHGFPGFARTARENASTMDPRGAAGGTAPNEP